MTKKIDHPLAVIRRQGLEADLYQARLRVYPRSRMNKTLCQFVTANLPAIIDGLVDEQKAKAGDDAFLWELPPKIGVELFGFEVDMVEIIPNHLNGEFYLQSKATP